jgi:hypothetical protein
VPVLRAASPAVFGIFLQQSCEAGISIIGPQSFFIMRQQARSSTVNSAFGAMHAIAGSTQDISNTRTAPNWRKDLTLRISLLRSGKMPKVEAKNIAISLRNQCEDRDKHQKKVVGRRTRTDRMTKIAEASPGVLAHTLTVLISTSGFAIRQPGVATSINQVRWQTLP